MTVSTHSRRHEMVDFMAADTIPLSDRAARFEAIQMTKCLPSSQARSQDICHKAKANSHELVARQLSTSRNDINAASVIDIDLVIRRHDARRRLQFASLASSASASSKEPTS